MAPRIFSLFYILIIIYFFNYETIVHWVPTFFRHNNLVLAKVTKQVLVFTISNQKMTFEE